MYIGIDIGGTKCAVIRADERGQIRERVAFPTTTCADTLARIFDEVGRLGQAEAIGVSCGGPLDADAGLILSPPNLPGWDGIPITAMLRERFGAEAYLQNDANACALAEWRFGAGQGCANMIFLTFGTGMGAGLILNGRLYAGTNGNAGEIGHVGMASTGPVGYGKIGSFEGFCSGGGLRQLGQAKATALLQAGITPSFCPDYAALNDITAKSIAEAALAGHADAREVYETCGAYLGRGLSLLVDLLNPQRIVLGSIYARSGSLLHEQMMAVMRRECLSASLAVCEILPAKLGDAIGDYAAISVAILGKEGKLHA